MKHMIVLSAAFAILAATATAQTVNYLLVQYGEAHTQTDGSTAAANSSPYAFRANIDGDSMTGSNPLSAATISLPGGSPTDTLAFSDNEWKYKSGAYGTSAALMADFPTGSYTFHLTGSSPANGDFAVTMSNPFSPAADLATPLLSLTNGTWSGGQFLVTDVSQPIMVSFNGAFTGSPGAQQGYHFDSNLNGNSTYVDGPEGFLNYDPTTKSSAPQTISNWTIPANTLVNGQTYTIQVTYDIMLSGDPTLSDNSGLAVTMLERSTQLTLATAAAVPEPATYALIAGLLVLLGAAGLRRRQKA